MEEKVTLRSDGHHIEGLLYKKSALQGAVITHPHPLYGGDMRNNVVVAVTRVYQRMGYATLRFNFRGVGGSQGSYADGLGEQEDVRAAIAFLQGMGMTSIDLAGYSFGAWVNAHLSCKETDITNMVMVSPPVAFIAFTSIKAIDCLRLIVTGSRDEIAPVEMIREVHPHWNSTARLEVIEGADHFYGGYLGELEAVLESHLQNR
jgi:uncharacterized protein